MPVFFRRLHTPLYCLVASASACAVSPDSDGTALSYLEKIASVSQGVALQPPPESTQLLPPSNHNQTPTVKRQQVAAVIRATGALAPEDCGAGTGSVCTSFTLPPAGCAGSKAHLLGRAASGTLLLKCGNQVIEDSTGRIDHGICANPALSAESPKAAQACQTPLQVGSKQEACDYFLATRCEDRDTLTQVAATELNALGQTAQYTPSKARHAAILLSASQGVQPAAPYTDRCGQSYAGAHATDLLPQAGPGADPSPASIADAILQVTRSRLNCTRISPEFEQALLAVLEQQSVVLAAAQTQTNSVTPQNTALTQQTQTTTQTEQEPRNDTQQVDRQSLGYCAHAYNAANVAERDALLANGCMPSCIDLVTTAPGDNPPLSASRRRALWRLPSGEKLCTPLVLDLDGDGQLTDPLAFVHFDLIPGGELERMAWIDPGDAWLVRDLDGDGLITSGAELLGDATLLADGSQAADGFAALAEHDLNLDGLIDTAEAEQAGLALWIDDGDALTEPGELQSLAARGVTQLSLAAHRSKTRDARGNLLGLQSDFTDANGHQHTLVDVYFKL